MPIWQRIGLEFLSHTIPLFHVSGHGLRRTPTDNLVVRKNLSADPLVIKFTRIDALHGLVNLMDAALKATPNLPSNTIVLIGGKENIMPDKAMSGFLELLHRNNSVEISRYPSGYHMLLRDLNARVVLNDLALWIKTKSVSFNSKPKQLHKGLAPCHSMP